MCVVCRGGVWGLTICVINPLLRGLIVELQLPGDSLVNGVFSAPSLSNGVCVCVCVWYVGGVLEDYLKLTNNMTE